MAELSETKIFEGGEYLTMEEGVRYNVKGRYPNNYKYRDRPDWWRDQLEKIDADFGEVKALTPFDELKKTERFFRIQITQLLISAAVVEILNHDFGSNMSFKKVDESSEN